MVALMTWLLFMAVMAVVMIVVDGIFWLTQVHMMKKK